MFEKSGTSHTIVFAVILIVAGLLRFWDLQDIPFFNDELSALTRTEFSGFSELIRNGVMVDAHPALTQVFLWIWTPLSDMDEWWVRLPFILMGLGSIVAIWHLTRLAADPFRANLVAALLAGGQLFIFNSVMARPYAPGMLITALYALYWYKMVYLGDHRTMNFIIQTLLIALVAYTHYFAGLTVIAIYFTGFFYMRKIPLRAYLLTSVAAFVLFLPHWKIFTTQLSYGGIGGAEGWLAVPELEQLIEWFSELFNYNPILIYIGLLALLISLFQIIISRRKGDRRSLLFLSWFAITYIIGFAYSVFRNPVMHILTLVFAFPFLIMAIVWPLKSKSAILRWAAPPAILALLVFSMVYTRNHYEVMRSQPFAYDAEKIAENPNDFTAVEGNPDYIDFYLKKTDNPAAHPDVNFYSGGKPLGEMAEVLDRFEGDTYHSDGRNGKFDELALMKFPHVEEMVRGYTFTGWTFTRGEDNRSIYFRKLFENDENREGRNEFYNIGEIRFDTSDISFANEIRSRAILEDSPPDNLHLVYVVRRGDQTIHWSASKWSNDGVRFGGKAVLTNSILLWDLFAKESEMENVVMKIYLWNQDREPMAIRHTQVTCAKANPNRYGLLYRRP